jgi:hypothetical protein
MRRAIHVVIMIVGGLTLAAGTVAAQTDTTPPAGPVIVGTRVRVWQRVASDVSMPVVGRVAHITSDSIALYAEGLTTPVALAWPSVARVEVSAGPRTESRTTGAARGGIIGALGGAVLGVVLGNMANRNAPKFGVVGVVVGGGIGAGIGAYTPGERWQPATSPTRPLGP